MILVGLLWFCTLPALAASVEIAFVVYGGNVYEVTDEEIAPGKIDGKIGQVTFETENTSSHYWGNASNYYPIGTNYFLIKGIDEDQAIAVKDESGKYKKVVYSEKASITSWLPKVFSSLFIMGLVVYIVYVAFFWKKK